MGHHGGYERTRRVVQLISSGGKEMKNAGVDRLFTIGEMGAHLANGFQGLAEHFSNKETDQPNFGNFG